jgi:hypothetical protein
MELKFDPKNLKRVPIDDVHPNGYNPKEKQHLKVKDIEKSIKLHGFKAPIQVRTENGRYEIIDGEQRWTAMKNLGATEIYIYDNGEVEDADAMNETLWWQVQVPFETIKLAGLVRELDSMEMELPYSAKEIAEFKGMLEHGDDGEKEKGDVQTMNFKLSPDQFELVKRAVEYVKAENECGDGRALELICADYLSGVSEA